MKASMFAYRCKSNQSSTLQEIPQLNYSMEYVTTHLQEIPQRIRWGSWREYILKCPCILFFGNQRLHNKIMLGGNRGALWGHVWKVLLHLSPLQGCCVLKQWFRDWKWRRSLSGRCVLGRLGVSDSTPRWGPVPWHRRLPPKSCVLC